MSNAEESSSAAELTEVLLDEEAARLAAQAEAVDAVEAVVPADDDAAEVPVLQLRNIDFSYGPVQVLFDVHLDVRRGETLALLGTNGAGKSTVLRVVSGLGIPSRGVVRLNGHNVTLCSPETRVKWGIHQLAGGKAIFAPMSVRENLEMAGLPLPRRPQGSRGRGSTARCRSSPSSATRLHDTAGSLSGGQQQMLGLAMALMHDPEILLIDELSLGLAPVMVESLLARRRPAQARGPDDDHRRAVAQRRARRSPSARCSWRRAASGSRARRRELLERDDLVRAVFLGSEQA